VFAYIIGTGNAALYTSTATVLCEGSTARILDIDNGGDLAITLSGLSVVVEQLSGITTPVSLSWVKIL